MAQFRQILSLVKADSSQPHERITHVNGVDPTGQPWTMTQAEAVASVEAGTWRFYASVWGRANWVVVATTAEGDKYLKTETDGLQPNNLLTVPAGPAA
jgi:hypothetical protein